MIDEENIRQGISQKFYSVYVSCSNCGHWGELTILRGQPVNSSKCPSCGCISLTKQDSVKHVFNL